MTPQFGGFFPPAPGAGLAPVAEAEQLLRRRIDIVMWFRAWHHDIDPPEQARWLGLLSPKDALITWEPWSPGSPGRQKQPEYSPSRIAEGHHDEYVTCWARLLAQYGKRVYLRPMHEMNGNWYPWSAPVSGEDPEAYVAAWRHMHSVFAGAGAGNVRWVWSPNADDVPAGNRLERYYPGGNYVDVLGLSGYNWGGTRAWSRWRSFHDVFSPAYGRICRLGPQPVWFTELACAPGEGKARWVTDMFEAVRRFPRLEALIWFNREKETDWRATHPPGVAASFADRPAGLAG